MRYNRERGQTYEKTIRCRRSFFINRVKILSRTGGDSVPVEKRVDDRTFRRSPDQRKQPAALGCQRRRRSSSARVAEGLESRRGTTGQHLGLSAMQRIGRRAVYIVLELRGSETGNVSK